MSEIFRLNSGDFIRGLVVAVLVVVLGSGQEMLTQHGLDVAAYDWAGILDLAWKAAVAYLGKNFLTAGNGKVLGSIG